MTVSDQTLTPDVPPVAPTAATPEERAEQLTQRLAAALVDAVDDDLCSAAWAYCLLDIAKESAVLAEDPDLYVAHLLHRSVRAEASKDGPPVSRIATMRAPDLGISPAAGLAQIPLPEVPPEEITALQETITARKSTPMFGEAELPLEQLAAVLRTSLGSKGMERGYQRRDIPRRMAPSAGGLQSFDTQVLVSRVEGLLPGRYLYDPLSSTLNLAEPGDFRSPLLESTIESGWIVHAQCVIAITGNFPRVAWKYGTRGYRYMGLDAGVAVGYVYLAAAALGLSVNALAAFADDATNAMLRLDGKDHFTHILISLGVSPGATG
jgi:SagB-type dehydrogenase family enzyme